MSWERDKYFFSHVPSVLPYRRAVDLLEKAKVITSKKVAIRKSDFPYALHSLNNQTTSIISKLHL